MKHKLFFVFLYFLSVGSFAQDFPEPMQPPQLINDFAGIIDPSRKSALERALVEFDDSTSTQIAIVTITNIGAYDIADYSYRLFEKWGIGSKKNNGALLLVALENRKVWITTGYGLEATLTDALAKRIIENRIKPAFREGDYTGGIELAAIDIMQIVKGEYKEARNRKGKGIPAIVVVIIIIVVLIILSRINRTKKNHMGRGIDLFTLLMLMNSGGSGGRGSFGDFSSGGGGFGGFGGGSSGGGGAGGSW